MRSGGKKEASQTSQTMYFLSTFLALRELNPVLVQLENYAWEEEDWREVPVNKAVVSRSLAHFIWKAPHLEWFVKPLYG